jgi:hypothetical protein
MAGKIQRQLTSTFEATQLAEALGFRRHEIPPDGNCLFRAVAELCLGSQGCSPDVRAAVTAYITEHRKRFEPFVDESFETYIDKLGRDGHWGSDLELQAMAELYHTEFTVFANQRPTITIRPTIAIEPSKTGAGRKRPKEAALWFSHGNHYDALYPPDEFESRGFHSANDELDAYKARRREEEEQSLKLTMQLSDGQPAVGDPPASDSSLGRQGTLADLRDAGVSEDEIAGQRHALTTTRATAADTARSELRGALHVDAGGGGSSLGRLSDEQKRRPTISNLLDAGFTEAELAHQFAPRAHSPSRAAGDSTAAEDTLPPELLRRLTVMNMLQAGMSEEEIRKQVQL